MTPPTLTADQRHALRIRIAEWDGIDICRGCNHRIDPECCHCGERIHGHAGEYHGNHSPIPMGCTCGYMDAAKMRAEHPSCPDYLNDKDAILDACDRKFKTVDERLRFTIAICDILGSILKFPTASAEALCLAYEAAMVGGKE